MFLCKNASDEWLQLQNYVREAKRNRNWHFDTFSQGQGNEYGSPLLPISHKKVEKVDYIMRIPPILAIFLLHPRNLEAQHAPGPRLLASTIQVLITIIQNKSIFLQGDWHRSKWIFLLHLQGGRFWKRGDLIIQVSSNSWKAGRRVPAATFHSSTNPDRIFYPKRFRIGNSIRHGFFRKPRRIGFFIRNGFG